MFSPSVAVMIPRHEDFERVCGVTGGEAGEGISEPRLGVDPAQLTGLDQARDHSPVGESRLCRSPNS